MSRRLLAVSSAAAAALLLTACGGDASSSEDAEGMTDQAGADSAAAVCSEFEPLRFSDTGVEGLETLVLEFEDFRVALEEVTGLEVEFEPMASRTAAATALQYDDLDVLLTGPAEYVVLKEEADALPLAGVTRENYKAAIFKRADSDLESVEDLEGGTLITKEVGSTSGHLGPLEMLVTAGLDPNVGDVDVVPLSDTHIEAFATGDGDALGTGISDLETIQEMMGEDAVEVLEEGPDLPNDLFIARTGLGEDCAGYLQDALVENQDVLLEAIVQTGENDKYLESEFVEAADSDYDPTRRAFEAAGFSQYADLPDEDEQ
ncbi:PhnD/SsuA/transferrin family substrate-binding protein [Citricoccus muralis]|uniref:PhnD/SsuA/transferrin family substrate-binding protein n=1 Tax=Citricoccus muralis TaxID=169134 RepID=A0ABY8H8X1_9MICC|nr:PhnD/SsuA/transferrin family substrate-binding protein [Citricoccus muralis]WFP17476.1 PhnD/SsuA/transferrin family substrate-binding protein [Citricoccus muralis]